VIVLDADELSFMLLGRRSIDLQRDLGQAGLASMTEIPECRL